MPCGEKKHGIVVPRILTATPFTGPDGTLVGIVKSFKDITELEKAPKAIREKRNKLQSILSHIKEGVNIVNLDLKIEFQNITHKKFSGKNEGKPRSTLTVRRWQTSGAAVLHLVE